MHKKFNYSFYVILIVTIIFISCSRHIYPSQEVEPIFYPGEPDTARIQFLTHYGNSSDVIGGKYTRREESKPG